MKALLILLCVSFTATAGLFNLVPWGDWRPPRPESLLVWVRAECVGNGTNFDTGYAVTRWPDWSSNRWHFTNGNATLHPLLSNSVGVNPLIFPTRKVMTRSGAFFNVDTNIFFGRSNAEMMVVIRDFQDPSPNEGSAFNGVWCWGVQTPTVIGASFVNYFNDQKIYETFFTTVRRDSITPGVNMSNTFRLYNVMSASSNTTSISNFVVRLDTTPIYADSTNVFGARAATLVADRYMFGAGRDTGGGPYSRVEFCEVILWSVVLTDNERRNVQNHLKQKWHLKGY
jgi:hypothetical protein